MADANVANQACQKMMLTILYKHTVFLCIIMNAQSPALNPEALHPALWRASQLGRATTKCIDTGHAALSTLLPGGGWPTGELTELLLQQAGIGELRLLAPSLAKVAARRVVMLDPPHPPQILALVALGIAPEKVIWLQTKNTADALWAAEQVLRSGSCGALLTWRNHLRPESVRRLNLAAQAGETLCFFFRQIAAAQDASAAPLRLSLRPANGGLEIGFVKRRGPSTDQTLFLPMPIGTVFQPAPQRHAEPRRTTPSRTSAPQGMPELLQ